MYIPLLLLLLLYRVLGQADDYYFNNRDYQPLQQHQQLPVVGRNNFHPEPYNTPYTPLSYSNKDFVQISPYYKNNGDNSNEFQQPPYSNAKSMPFAVPSAIAVPTDLWSGPPIVVEDINDYHSTTNRIGRVGNKVSSFRSTNNLHSNHHTQGANDEGRNEQPHQLPPQLQPSHFNYDNGVVYHSDIRRHQIFNSAHTEASTTGQGQQPQQKPQINLKIYNEPETSTTTTPNHQRYHGNVAQSNSQQLYATTSNTDLNYYRTRSIFNGATETDPLAERGTDYAKHFMEYLKKYPRRIKPEY